jgi:hypothetical protein
LPSAAAAAFVKADITTRGSWKGVYGADGYNVIGNLAAAPAYVAMTASGYSQWIWAASSTDPRALQKPSLPADRLAACWYAPSSFSLDLRFTDQQSHQVALYLTDWDSLGRIDRVDILDANNNVLDTRTASNFAGGQYLVWNLSGHVIVRITATAILSAVVSGIFFDGSPGLPAAAAFVKTDITTRGSWQGVYGADGYNVIGDLAAAPAYVTMTPSGYSQWIWAASSADPRALQKPSLPADRLAACWYAPTTFSLDFRFTDQQSHQVALYLTDWDSRGRIDRVDILDANNNVLDTRTVSNFAGGQYWVWNLSGHVIVRITPTAILSGVVSGIFFR